MEANIFPSKKFLPAFKPVSKKKRQKAETFFPYSMNTHNVDAALSPDKRHEVDNINVRYKTMIEDMQEKPHSPVRIEYDAKTLATVVNRKEALLRE